MVQTLLLKNIAYQIQAFDSTLKQIENFIDSQQYVDQLASAVAHALIFRHELGHLVELGSQLGEELGQGVTVSRIRQRVAELDVRWQRCQAAMGADKIGPLAMDTLKRYVADYSERISVQVKYLEQHGTEQYTIDFLDEELYNYETLTIRDRIESLLHELNGDLDTGCIATQLEAADRIMRARGRDIYSPFIANGRLQSLREANLLPRSHWWYYLDTITD